MKEIETPKIRTKKIYENSNESTKINLPHLQRPETRTTDWKKDNLKESLNPNIREGLLEWRGVSRPNKRRGQLPKL